MSNHVASYIIGRDNVIVEELPERINITLFGTHYRNQAENLSATIFLCDQNDLGIIADALSSR